ncbi:hypothetical protein JHK84_045394 [Glycine max]|nr:hypothetical protein JHK84_045394 [Glycine max]
MPHHTQKPAANKENTRQWRKTSHKSPFTTLKYISFQFSLSIIAVLVVDAGVLSLITKHGFGHSNSPEVTSHHPTYVIQKYASALELDLQFFDVQKSGKLEKKRVWWRGDSGLRDGSEENLDLSKGMYDAGDHMKFGFPLAFTATMFSWAILEYGDRMDAVKQLHYALDSLKWITDNLVNAHPFPEVLYIQFCGVILVKFVSFDIRAFYYVLVADKQPVLQGTEVAAETAAALASASLVFNEIDFAYSRILLQHAQQPFIFADTYRVSYSVGIPHLVLGMNSYGQVLLSRVNFFGASNIPDAENLDLQMYRETAEILMCMLLPDSPTATTNRTESGLIWVVPWNSLQLSVASVFLAVLYRDYMLTSQTEILYCSGKLYKPVDLRKFSISQFQADYVLGENPMKMSYLVGYGTQYPKYLHHRGSSIAVNATTGCKDGFKWFESPHPNPNVAFGALVGGPFFNETYNDFRNNSMQSEPTTYNGTSWLLSYLAWLLVPP